MEHGLNVNVGHINNNGPGIKHRPAALTHPKCSVPQQYCHKMEQAKPLATDVSNDLSISKVLQYLKKKILISNKPSTTT